MNTDFRVSVDFFVHHKTRRIQRLAGDSGVIGLLRLWAYAAKHRSDGILAGMGPADIEAVADWVGEEGKLAQALLEIGFLDQSKDGLSLHGWRENNPWAAEAKARSESARNAASMRWSRSDGDVGGPAIRRKRPEKIGAKIPAPDVGKKIVGKRTGGATSGQCPNDAGTMRVSCSDDAPSPSPSPIESDSCDDSRKLRAEIHALRDAIWRMHGFSDSQIETRKIKGSTEGIAEINRWIRLGLTIDDLRAKAILAFDLAEQRGETIKNPWKYLSVVMARLADEAPAGPEREPLSGDDLWRFRLNVLHSGGAWSGMWGPHPDAPFSTCLAPDYLLAEFGYVKKDKKS